MKIKKTLYNLYSSRNFYSDKMKIRYSGHIIWINKVINIYLCIKPKSDCPVYGPKVIGGDNRCTAMNLGEICLRIGLNSVECDFV